MEKLNLEFKEAVASAFSLTYKYRMRYKCKRTRKEG